jgi:hypothetical protein
VKLVRVRESGPGNGGGTSLGSCRAVAALTIAACLAVFAAAPAIADELLKPAAGVPGEGRAWELVSPEDPMSARLWGVHSISPDGNRVSFATLGPMPDAGEGRPLIAPALVIRGATGWADRTNPPPPNDAAIPTPLRFSADFGTSLWLTNLPADDPISPGNYALFRRVSSGDTLLAVGPSFGGASADLQHVLFTSAEHLLPADSSRSSGQSVYEAVGSTLRLVDVDDSGAPLSDCGAGSASISVDGSRIFFSTAPDCTGPTRAFMRVDGAVTEEIGTSQCDLPACGEVADVQVAAITPSGSSAYLSTAERLLDDDADSLPDLYRYDVADRRLTLISSGWEGENLVATAVSGFADDGSRSYFSAVDDATHQTNLYVVDGSGIARLPGTLGGAALEVSGDGHFAVYASAAQLAPADTDESVDIYRYDAEQRAVTLVSAAPVAGSGPFDATISRLENAGDVRVDRYRVMSADGSRIFFATPEQLLPADRNDALDVYEWANGSLSLISAGTGEFPSHFVNSTADGATVLFETPDTLVPADRDGGSWDYYAARIGGGFPAALTPPKSSESATLPPMPRRGGGRPAGPGAGRAIRLARIDAAARREIVASGRIVLLAEIPTAGRLSATASARVGGHEQVVAAASILASKPGPVRLRMRLEDRARRRLLEGVDLRLRLRLHLSGLESVRRASIELQAKP